MKKKKVLFIIWSFTFGGGAERVLATLANNMPKDKYDIDILEYWHSNVHTEQVDSNIRILKPVVDSINDSRFKRIFKYILVHLFPSVLRRKYVKENYDIEISYNYLIPTFLLRKKGKTISWLHGDIYNLKKEKINYLLQRKAFKYVDKIVAISENTYKSIEDVYPEYKNKLEIIHNGYNFNNMYEKSKEFDVDKKNVKEIIFLGRLEDNKNPLFLIEVAKLLKEDNVLFHISFLGKGELENDMLAKIKEYGLDKNIDMLGYISNPYPYINNSDIVVGCSKSEGFPTVYVEGLSFGKPFVSTKVGGSLELSNDEKCGFVTSDLKEYKNYLKKLITDKKIYDKMSKNALEYSKNFSIEAQVKNVDELINKVLGD